MLHLASLPLPLLAAHSGCVSARVVTHELLWLQILEMQEDLDKAAAKISAATGEARTKGNEATDLERDLRKEQKRAEEVSNIVDLRVSFTFTASRFILFALTRSLMRRSSLPCRSLLSASS